MAAALVVAVVKPAEAAFPGRNGKIAFAGLSRSDPSTTDNWEIYTTYLRSFKLVNITNTPSASELFPAWSPNGKKIAYQRSLNGSTHIYVMNANGSRKKRLTDSSGDGSPVLLGPPTAPRSRLLATAIPAASTSSSWMPMAAT
jgi:Tol biopolymer transport system component